MRNKFLPTIALAMALVLAACDNTGGDLSAEQAVATTEVSVVDNDFEPNVVEVSAGDTVTWTWSGSSPHDVDGEGFQSEVQSTGTFQHTFDTAGEYEYVCNIHGGMTGLVVVTDQ
jgi:plastocyanin